MVCFGEFVVVISHRLLCLVNLLSCFTKYVVVFSKHCVAFAVVGHRSEYINFILYCRTKVAASRQCLSCSFRRNLKDHHFY